MSATIWANASAFASSTDLSELLAFVLSRKKILHLLRYFVKHDMCYLASFATRSPEDIFATDSISCSSVAIFFSWFSAFAVQKSCSFSEEIVSQKKQAFLSTFALRRVRLKISVEAVELSHFLACARSSLALWDFWWQDLCQTTAVPQIFQLLHSHGIKCPSATSLTYETR